MQAAQGHERPSEVARANGAARSTPPAGVSGRSLTGFLELAAADLAGRGARVGPDQGSGPDRRSLPQHPPPRNSFSMAVQTQRLPSTGPTNPTASYYYEALTLDPHFDLNALSRRAPHPFAVSAIRLANDAAAAAASAASNAVSESAVATMLRARADRRLGACPSRRQLARPYPDRNSRSGAAFAFQAPMTAAGRFLAEAQALSPGLGLALRGPRLGGPIRIPGVDAHPARPDPPPEYDVVDASPSYGDTNAQLVFNALRRSLAAAQQSRPQSLVHHGSTAIEPAAPSRESSSAHCMRGRELSDAQRADLDAYLEGLGGEALRKSVCCSITLDVMNNPVVAADGYTYERSAIERWVAAKLCSPMTNESMGPQLVPNLALRNVIDAALAKMEQAPARRERPPQQPA